MEQPPSSPTLGSCDSSRCCLSPMACTSAPTSYLVDEGCKAVIEAFDLLLLIPLHPLTVGRLQLKCGTSRPPPMVTGAMQAEDPQEVPARYPKPGRPHLEATRPPQTHVAQAREPRQPRARKPHCPHSPAWPLARCIVSTTRGRTAEQELKLRPPHLKPC